MDAAEPADDAAPCPPMGRGQVVAMVLFVGSMLAAFGLYAAMAVRIMGS